ncbi:hypothetical protein LWF01_03955 [Saxibacter everestensis]|uniref:Uncharacterized protein n=1 Tax=Saxibacter everestensis TaxID=2909229 RepID=A0ABY8QV85_9MICO|nr:hypothetical protein LWF01_03955 [Brevibacteriaceae bacterium ZFBP1038]
MPQRPQRSYKGTGYWTTQIAFCALMTLLGFIGGGFLLFEANADGGKHAEPGRGLMLILIGIAFLITLIWLIVQIASSTKEQRAVYAWAIMQQHSQNIHDGRPENSPRAVTDDIVAMNVATKARKGELTRAQIEHLQSLRPEIPYPGRLPDVRSP